ncbi:MAG: hypothetical protein PWQ55_1456 [Chloroflexota bacterium]|nr:hypothetical protein [Chloroflexota bacterium]
MTVSKILQPKYIAIAFIVLTLGVVAYGYAAANVVPESGAGDGTGTVSGYDISNIDYTLLSSDPTKVESVAFDVVATAGAGAPNEVQITVDSGTTWVSCTGPETNTWTCAFTVSSEPSVSAIESLQVVAAE